MRVVLMLAGAILLAGGCAQHRLTVANPNPTGEPRTVASSAFGWGAVQKRSVADCPTNLIDEVRVKQNFGQSLATVLTLGMWMPTRLEYRCAKVPTEGGSTDDE